MGEAHREAFLFGKGTEPAVLAGSPFFTEVFTQLGCECVCRPSKCYMEIGHKDVPTG